MKGLGAYISMIALVALSPASVAQAPEGEPERPPANPPAAEEPEVEAPEPEDAGDDVFIPSEEIQADEEVTFPVDI